MTTEEAFESWWFNEGSGMPPLPDEDAEAHVHRVARIAWLNGVFKAEESVDGPTLSRITENRTMWWGYLHQNGSIQVKRWYGDHDDYTTDCDGNDFVEQVVPPFAADSREKAIEIITQRLNANPTR